DARSHFGLVHRNGVRQQSYNICLTAIVPFERISGVRPARKKSVRDRFDGQTGPANLSGNVIFCAPSKYHVRTHTTAALTSSSPACAPAQRTERHFKSDAKSDAK